MGGNPRSGGRCDARGDARNDLEGNAAREKGESLSPPRPNTNGSPPGADDGASGAGVADRARRDDRVLSDRHAAAAERPTGTSRALSLHRSRIAAETSAS
jgi:hypothetical protein